MSMGAFIVNSGGNSRKSLKMLPTAAVFMFGSPTEALRGSYITPNPTAHVTYRCPIGTPH